MIKKYLLGGSYGGAKISSSGGTPKPYDFNKLADPLFILNEYGQTVAGANKQLQGMRDMLHSLPAPSSAPEVFTPDPNYNAIDQQYIDAEANLKNTPILGTSINQHIAQQQALGEQGVKLDHQRIQTLADMRNSALIQAAKDEQQNALSRYQTAEERRKFDMAIKQQIQDNEDAATAIKTNAASQAAQEFYSLHKMQEMRNDIKKMNELQRGYNKERQTKLNAAEADHNLILENEFRDEFMKLYNAEDVEPFEERFGINPEDYDQNIGAMLESDIYKAKLDEYKASKEADWIEERNKLLTDFDEYWMNNHPEYYDLRTNLALSGIGSKKKGGKVTKTTQSKTLSKNDRIAIENNKALHSFIKQMNDKQTKIFLKLMSL